MYGLDDLIYQYYWRVLLSTSLWKIYLYALIFICLNPSLFVIICKNLFFYENLSLFLIIMRISPYLRSSWESLPINDHYENLSLFMIIHENHFFMKIFIICENLF